MVRILLYIGWCFLDLKWTFYRALLPIYIKNDSGVFVPHLARATILTDSCQVFVLQLYLCNDSVLIILYYDHCPVAMYLICSHHFVVISTNKILDMQMYHRQLFWVETYFNCICYMLPSLWSLPCPNVPEMFRLLCFYINKWNMGYTDVSQTIALVCNIS